MLPSKKSSDQPSITTAARIIQLHAKGNFPELVKLQTASGHVLVKPDKISLLSAAGNYCQVTTSTGAQHLQSCTLNKMVTRLGGKRFVLVHQSHAVNMSHIDSIDSNDGQITCRLFNGTEVPVSRRKYKSLPIHII